MSNYDKTLHMIGSLVSHRQITAYPKKKTWHVTYTDGTNDLILEEDIKVQDPLFTTVLEFAKLNLQTHNKK